MDDEDNTNEKKSSRSKKVAAQQPSLDRLDSTIDDTLHASSTTVTANHEPQESSTPTQPEPYVPYISVRIGFDFIFQYLFTLYL